MKAFHCGRARVICRKCEQDLVGMAFVAGEKVAQIGGAALGVLARIERIDMQVTGGGGHQLHQADRAFGRNCSRLKRGLRLHDAADERLREGELAGGIGSKPGWRNCCRDEFGLRHDDHGPCGCGQGAGTGNLRGILAFEGDDQSSGQFSDATSGKQLQERAGNLMMIGVEPETGGQHRVFAALQKRCKQRQSNCCQPGKMEDAPHA